MTKIVVIEQIKHIERLEFKIPGAGVYLLSGTNGSGKSCLLTCLLRIGAPNAFQLAFKTSKMSKMMDEFSGGKVSYIVGNESVTYTYSGSRWVPTPKRNSKLLNKLGYACVIHAAANSERIEPRPEDFKPNRVKDAPLSLRTAAKEILDDEKFDNLKVINVRRGVGAEAYLILDQEGSTPKKKLYFSEKNFSLGEICVLKLLRQLEDCPHRSLVLIDELELALHPRAQIGLLKYLETISLEKELTTIFSTHSVSLIKAANRKKLFFIDRIDGETEIIEGCYPTYALGHLALREERSPDIALYVEDEQAQFIVDALVKTLLQAEFSSRAKPTVAVVPVGPINAVISFLSRSTGLLGENIRQYALLDKDAYDEYFLPLKTAENHVELAKIKNVEDRLAYLPWTPEVGMCTFIGANRGKREKEIREFFSDNRITLNGIDFQSVALMSAGGQQRKKAKAVVRQLVNEIAAIDTTRTADVVRRDLSEYFALSVLNGTEAANVKKLLMPLIVG